MEKESIKELILTSNLDWSQPYNEHHEVQQCLKPIIDSS